MIRDSPRPLRQGTRAASGAEGPGQTLRDGKEVRPNERKGGHAVPQVRRLSRQGAVVRPTALVPWREPPEPKAAWVRVFAPPLPGLHGGHDCVPEQSRQSGGCIR